MPVVTSTSALPGTTISNLTPAITLDGTELIPLVQGGTTKYGTAAQVAQSGGSGGGGGGGGAPTTATVVVTSSYNSISTDIRILVNVPSAASILLLPSASYTYPVLVKDISGAADTNPITITFNSGQTLDGLSSVVLNNPYAWCWFNPAPSGGYYET